jgi:formylglycine-generating enzyme required for sulfatase activity
VTRSCTGLLATALVTVAFAGGAALSRAGATAPGAASAAKRLCADYNGLPDGAGPLQGMVWIPAGEGSVGDDHAYPEEAPAVRLRIEGFWMDRHAVTNAQFARFVQATGYVTQAERGDAAQDLAPGSVVFVPPDPLEGTAGAWRYVVGANWRHPAGPGSDLRGLANHPVVQVSFNDALAYARWAGRELPSEAELEIAARGGIQQASYAWGEQAPGEHFFPANTWQGEFPYENRALDGYSGTAPVGCFAANAYGLFDATGNVWQWTRSWYRPGHQSTSEGALLEPDALSSFDPRQPGVPVRVIKGGSHLCAPNYCQRYRPAARQAQDPGLGTSHLGFRTVLHAPAAPEPG